MAKRTLPLFVGAEHFLAELQLNCGAYGLDFHLNPKSNKNVTYIRVTTRMARPAPFGVISYLHGTAWKGLQTLEAIHDVYRFRKYKHLLVVTFPSKAEYEAVAGHGAVFSDDRGSYRKNYNGIVNRNS